jgi:hypothetical protein
VIIGASSYVDATHPAASYIQVEGLVIRDASTINSSGFKDSAGAQRAYECGASSIYIMRAQHITILRNTLLNSNNGLFVNSNNGNQVSNVSVLFNHIFGSGIAAGQGGCTYYGHNVYTEANGIRFAFNRFGAARAGTGGNMLKDRSAGLVVEYNLFQGNGQLETSLGYGSIVGTMPGFSHVMDLVESYDPGVGLYPLGAVYQNVVVRGNVILADGTQIGDAGANGVSTMVHFGGDQGDGSKYRKFLHFYNNTLVSRVDYYKTGAGAIVPYGSYRSGIFQLEGQVMNAWNNILYVSSLSTSTPTNFSLLDPSGGTVNYLAQNWVSPLLSTQGLNGTASDPGFKNLATGDVHLKQDNVAIVGTGRDVNGSAYAANQSTMPLQYADYFASEARPFTATNIDLGAFGYAR